MTNTDTSNGGKPERINLRFTLPSSTPEGKTAHYLLHNPNWAENRGKALILEGATMIWLPRALRNKPEEAREAALHSVRVMLMHIRDLVGEFNLTEIKGIQVSPQVYIPLSASSDNPTAVSTNSNNPDPVAVDPAPPANASPSPAPSNTPPMEADLNGYNMAETSDFYADLNVMLN